MKLLKILLVFTLALVVNVKAQKTDDQLLEELFHNTYKFYQALRHTNGAYYDMVKMEGTTDRGSVANIGMGLMSLCVGHAMGWEPTAEEKVIQTLKAVSGQVPGFNLPRTAKGCYIHFYDINTGAARGSNWSPIDTDLMLGGALFARNYFKDNTEIYELATNLYNTTDHSVFVGDVDKGQIALGMYEDGTPNGNWTVPFNEYMIVAWFAKNQANDENSPAHKLWMKHYENPSNLKHAVYNGKDGDFEVASPSLARFTSMFTFMFNHNFVNHFSSNKAYIDEMRMAMKADSAWWADRSDAGDVDLKALGWQPYEYGTGAGVGAPDSKYQVDRICLPENMGTSKDQNQNLNVSPHILAGFSPAAPDRVREDLLSMLKDTRKIGQVDVLPGTTILWKYSYSDLDWKPNKVEGVDYSCMFFGLAALPQFLGTDFFNKYNDFFSEKPSAIRDRQMEDEVVLSPNPSKNQVSLDGIRAGQGYDSLKVYNISGALVKEVNVSTTHSSRVDFSVGDLANGNYLVCLSSDRSFITKKLVKN
ncbi:T9SS type A sorting domain-containing protein [Carboxylicivirga mesophila]|uniref:T9SS type A sorting domain-containing protein n=1 Tax=Carboxylicivirga mesophila TaxID=1166478 RepID=A0ABS5K5L4_9BACT|nr:T9SS type A sorting domain-containing protein [Carboxylicivirga mesophila]MBS2210275.1 T9SS type A sorting domain-containing protein [Carboxylicivirga mesophila]